VTEYYKILEVKKDCDEADVKKAYRKVSYIYTGNIRAMSKVKQIDAETVESCETLKRMGLLR